MKAQASDARAERRKALFDRVQEIAGEQAPVLYLLNHNALVGWSPALRNVQPSVLPPRLLWNVDEIRLVRN
jgi:ABC-type transport system substrate-binding protein